MRNERQTPLIAPGSRLDLRRPHRAAGPLTLLVALQSATLAPPAPPQLTPETAAAAVAHPLLYINTSFENASPLSWEVDSEGVAHAYLVYDHERGSPNRANGHWHFEVHAEPGAELTMVLHNFDNVYNGALASAVSQRTISFAAEEGAEWRVIPTERLPGNRLELRLQMPGPALRVARLPPYGLSDLERLLAALRDAPQAEIRDIGQTVEGRPLEIVRIGDPAAPRRVLLRGRAHPWESGGNWVIDGLIRHLLRQDDETRRRLARVCTYVLPIANKDGVARGRTRFNSRGKDLNRDWCQPADPRLAPENWALEQWIEQSLRDGRNIDLAIDFHNDDAGKLHVSRPPRDPEPYLARMALLEQSLRQHTWFTEGAAPSNPRTSGTFGDGLLARYGITACIHELNANWIAGLAQPPSREAWQIYGQQLCTALQHYFDSLPAAGTPDAAADANTLAPHP